MTPTVDRFLGSLMGAYIGHHYSANCQKPLLDSHIKPLYQSWLENAQSYMSTQPPLWEDNFACILPWLLYHHDDVQTRCQGLTIPALAAASSTEVAATAYILGSCLEWLMQSSPSHQYPWLSLHQHLQQQQDLLFVENNHQISSLIDQLRDPSPMASWENIGHEPALTAVVLAINSSFTYRENIALAFASSQSVDPIPTLIGCLLGAWGGTSIIPTDWMMALSNDCKQSIILLVQMLYRSWAGLASKHTSAIYEVTALDL